MVKNKQRTNFRNHIALSLMTLSSLFPFSCKPSSLEARTKVTAKNQDAQTTAYNLTLSLSKRKPEDTVTLRKERFENKGYHVKYCNKSVSELVTALDEFYGIPLMSPFEESKKILESKGFSLKLERPKNAPENLILELIFFNKPAGDIQLSAEIDYNGEMAIRLGSDKEHTTFTEEAGEFWKYTFRNGLTTKESSTKEEVGKYFQLIKTLKETYKPN